MDENTKEISVYALITNLCEKELNKHKIYSTKKIVNRLRSGSYGILLGKRITPDESLEDLIETYDAVCQLLAWQYVLTHCHNNRECATKIQNCVDALEKSNSFDYETFMKILKVLLKLKKPPESEQNFVDRDINPINNSYFKFYDENQFKLPDAIANIEFKYADNSRFLLPKTTSEVTSIKSVSIIGKLQVSRIPSGALSFVTPESTRHDEDCASTSKDLPVDVWEIASKARFTNLRTWETLGNTTPAKELPFLMEAGPEISSLIHKYRMINRVVPMELKIISHSQFVRDVKNVLVGIISNTFQYNENKKIELTSGVSIEGITHEALKAYSKFMIFCGTCYKALSEMIEVDLYTNKHKQDGYIFTEICESIKRYLSYYRIAALSLPAASGILALHNHIRKLGSHLHMLASTFKVGPFAESQQIPHGVALLNYLYEKVLGITDQDVLKVLYSVLYPCLQVYFIHFLRKWLLEGSIIDPYNEFFIAPNLKYLGTRGRTYWTRSFCIREDIVPTFISDLQLKILECGKAMNLLKFCVPNSPTCKYLMGKNTNILQCCIMPHQLKMLEDNAYTYYLEIISSSTPRFSMNNLLRCSYEEEKIFLDLIATKRALTIQRIELEKLKRVKELNDKKQHEMQMLKEEYDKAMKQKEAAKALEIEKELKQTESLAKMKQMEEQIIRKEAEDMINYYEKLFDESDKKLEMIKKHVEILQKFQLDSDNIEKKKKDYDCPSPESHPINEDGTPEDELIKPESLDIINANINPDDTNLKTEDSEFNINKNLTEAQKNKKKILAAMGIIEEEEVKVKKEDKKELTDAQRNKLRVLSSDIGKYEIETKIIPPTNAPLTEAQRNKIKIMGIEMGIDIRETKTKKITTKSTELTEAQKNKLKVMSAEYNLEPVNLKKFEVRTLSSLEAAKNKLKVMSTEYNIEPVNIKKVEVTNLASLEAEKNKLKVISTEYNIEPLNIKNFEVDTLSNLEVNRNVNLASNECFQYNLKCNNNNFVNENFEEESVNDVVNQNYIVSSLNINKSANLRLDLNTRNPMEEIKCKKPSIFANFMKSPNFEFQKPMSVDSTPISPIPKFPDNFLSDNLSTAASNFTDEGFNFNLVEPPSDRGLSMEVSKRITKSEAENISLSCVNYFIKQSILVPITVQTSLVQNELMKYFIEDLNYLKHLISLRNYFFLLDGEFCRNITEGLFQKLYKVSNPEDLVNFRVLSNLIYSALNSSSKTSENSNYLSFKINDLPEVFDLGSIDVLDCISLSYKVNWPLNILLPSNAIAKYDEVFKFLLKLHRAGWVMRKVFMELKLLIKEVGKKEMFLILSPQFQKLQHCRYVMLHFIQTLQTYVVREVLQCSWASFEENLSGIRNLDELYLLHANYIKNILFMCLLNQSSAPIRKILNNIFTVILKFYDYLRSRMWEFHDDVYIHPNFKKLEGIFNNFLEFVEYLFKAGQKVARTGYQPQLVQFLDILDINQFYSKLNSTQKV